MKYALCVGINAYGGGNTLHGCVNDARDWGAALALAGYEVEYMLDGTATLDNIKQSLIDMIGMLKYRDRVVFTYSGHGTFGTDVNGDEPDQHDEAICPVDCFQAGMLYDDEIGTIFSRRPYGVRALQVSDSCFSGSVNRLLGDPHGYLGVRGAPRFLDPGLLPFREKPPTERRIIGKPAMLMSGCDDTEYSYDAWYGNRANGAFTRVALDTLYQKPTSYAAWHKAIRALLPSDDYPQSPQVDLSLYQRYLTPLA